jgi:hypothetical protein
MEGWRPYTKFQPPGRRIFAAGPDAAGGVIDTTPMRSALFALVVVACVPPGNSTPSDAGVPTFASPQATSTAAKSSPGAMTTPFEDNFDRAPVRRTVAPVAPAFGDAAGEASAVSIEAAASADDGLGPNWRQAQTSVWHIENGRLCGQGARNHGVWLNRVMPVNARIEFDAISDSTQGDLKAEVWGDGQSSAASISYTDATSYLTILGGWKNKFHVLARVNEHGEDRKQIVIDTTSDDPRERPAVRGQSYRFKIERSDGHTVRWWVDGLEYLTYDDPAPLAGAGHDHFGFNDWEVRLCFDNVKVTPL